ncbi:unnamed protein product [Jaminaea pallidilutea]
MSCLLSLATGVYGWYLCSTFRSRSPGLLSKSSHGSLWGNCIMANAHHGGVYESRPDSTDRRAFAHEDFLREMRPFASPAAHIEYSIDPSDALARLRALVLKMHD